MKGLRRMVAVGLLWLAAAGLGGAAGDGAGAGLALGLEGEGMAPGAELGLRFLWPNLESAPGRDLAELKVEVAAATEPAELPPSWELDRVMDLQNGAGELVARARLLRHQDVSGVWALETTILKDITAPTGKYELPHFGLPAVKAPKGFGRVLTFKVEEFLTPVHRPFPSSGPVVMFNDRLDVVVVSPLDNFMDAMTAPERGEWKMGFGGMIQRVPAGTVHKVLIVSGHGINDAFMKWGRIIQAWHGHRPAAPDSDVAMSRLGYWTDNGSYYYYRTEPDLNYHDTLLAVKRDAEAAGIPYGYFQIDSWWYPKAWVPLRSSHYRGGCLEWVPIPEMFPQGLGAFTQELGLPLVAHNRYFADTSPYCDRYPCAQGNDPKRLGAIPTDPKFWDEIMDNAVSFGVQVYEQDWLYTNMAMIPWLREDLGNAASWYDAMAGAADRRGLTLQLCMASPEFFLQQLKHPNETHARVAHDYKGGLAKSFFWVPFHEASLFASAVGLWPFKDNFQTSTGQRSTYMIVSETSPLEEALIAALSGGPVGPSDRIGFSNRDLIMKTCRDDGVLLKPDRPATPIDLMWLDNINMATGGNKPWIVSTFSDHQVGRALYLSAFNIWPQRMIDPSIKIADLNLDGDHVVYDFINAKVLPPNDRIRFGHMPYGRAFYYVLAPLLDNGLALIGEPNKFITLSAKRFPSIKLDGGRLMIKLEGVPGERIELLLYSTDGGQTVTVDPAASETLVPGLNRIELTIGEKGEAAVEVE